MCKAAGFMANTKLLLSGVARESPSPETMLLSASLKSARRPPASFRASRRWSNRLSTALGRFLPMFVQSFHRLLLIDNGRLNLPDAAAVPQDFGRQ
jgi:hypothetical protein